jgi:hypothetical protein
MGAKARKQSESAVPTYRVVRDLVRALRGAADAGMVVRQTKNENGQPVLSVAEPGGMDWQLRIPAPEKAKP